jgi:DNA anti-recombination protein RmuC
MQAFLAYTFSLYNAILIPFGTPDFGPKLATGLLALAVAVFLCFLCFALPQAHRLRSALNVIRGKSNNETEHEKRTAFQGSFEAIDSALLSNKATSNVWQEFRKTLIFRGSSQRAIILASTRPSNFFNPRSLLVQYDFVRSLPNFFVGLGLLGTFIGLIAALTFSTKSLTTAVDQEKIKEALNQLLTTAAAKFYISAAGLVASLVLSLLIRLTLKHLHSRVHQINDALQERLLFVSEQNITEKQLSVQQESLAELKLFNTNIAMKIGDAVRSAVEASNDSLTNKLSEIAESFSRLIDASGAGAGTAVGEAMKGAFETSLRQAGDAIGSIAAELKDLPARLSEAAVSIQKVGSAAAEQQEQLATTIQETVKAILHDAGNQIAENIGHGTQDLVQGLAKTGSNFGASAERIEAILERFSDSGDSYIESLSTLSAKNAELHSGLSAISSHIAAAADSVSKAGATVDNNMGKLLSGLSDVTRLSAETNRTSQESQAAIRGMIDALQKQMSVHMERFNNVDETLARVFSSIGSHLELQSKQMGEQLTTMDQALARAVNQFEQLIEDLTDAMSARQSANRP